MTDESTPPEGRTGRRADRSRTTPQAGRRAEILRGRRVDAIVVLAILLPSVVGIGLALTDGDELPAVGDRNPTPARLTNAAVVCPAGEADGQVRVTRAPGVDGGELSVRTGEGGAEELREAEPVAADPLPDGSADGSGPTVVPDSGGPVILTGSGAAAPGIVAGRDEASAVPECRGPAFDEWFVGLGAAAKNSSTIELVNPDPGPAIVDVTLIGPRGPIDEDALRGIEVPGRGVKVLALSEVAPRRADLAAHLTVSRGRVSASVRHTYDPLGRADTTTDFIPAQADPATEHLLLGVPTNVADGTVFVANTSDDELRVSVKVVTEQSVFEPSGGREVVVPPQQLRGVRLSRLVPPDVAKDALGLQVTTTEEAVVAVRSFADDDLALVAPSPVVAEQTAAVLPEGEKRLVLGGADRAGTVHVTTFDADGEVLAEERVEIVSGRGAALGLPAEAVAVTVESRNTPVSGTVVVTGPQSAPGVGLVRLRDAEVFAEVPAVVPGR